MMLGLIIIVIVVLYLINSSNKGRSCCRNNQAHAHTSLDILDERYARGEIDREEYLERKQELSGQNQSISLKKGQ